jgi:carbamoyl-phosphate synthase large subunit
MNILYPSCGGLGWPAAWAELDERGHRIVGVDARENHHGKYLTDEFYQVPPYSEEQRYVEAVEDIVEQETIDYIMGGHTRELILLQEAGFDNVLSSDPDTLRATEDKYETYDRFRKISPEFAKIETEEELYREAERMGFPDRQLCIKPVVGSGSRGFRILVDDYDQTKWTFEHKKDPHIRIDDLASLDFPPLLLMEYLDGPVYHVDILADDGELKKAVVSHRLEERFGFGFSLTCDDRPEYVDLAEQVVTDMELDYNCFIQIMDGKLLEVGGRMAGSGGIGLDLARGAIDLAEGREPNTDVQPVTMLRYWKEIFVDPDTNDVHLIRDFP